MTLGTVSRGDCDWGYPPSRPALCLRAVPPWARHSPSELVFLEVTWAWQAPSLILVLLSVRNEEMQLRNHSPLQRLVRG